MKQNYLKGKQLKELKLREKKHDKLQIHLCN